MIITFKNTKIKIWLLIVYILTNHINTSANDRTTISITPKFYFACDNNGNVLWKKPFSDQIKFYDHWYTNHFLIGKYNNFIFMFDAKTGENLWIKKVSIRILSCEISGDTVILGTLKDNLCYDAISGKVLATTKRVARKRKEEIPQNYNERTYSYDYFKETNLESFRGIITTSGFICGFDIDANIIYKIPVKGMVTNIFTAGGKRDEDRYAIFITNNKCGVIVIATYSGEVVWEMKFEFKIVFTALQQRLFGKHRLKLTFSNGNVQLLNVQDGALINK